MKKIIYLVCFLFFTTIHFANGQCGKYLVLNSFPWGSTDDQVTMDAVFGINGWTLANYSANASSVFSPSNCFVMLEGSESGNPTALKNFLIANNALIENWVANGGRLFINAAPNEGGSITCGFGGTIINYNFGPYCNTASAVNSGDPVFQGPFTPVSTSYTGNYFSHASVSGTGLTNLLTGTNPAPPGTLILAYKKWGTGVVFFGGLTQPGFWSPQPHANNLWKNILSYVNVIPTFSISCSVSGTAFCSTQASAVTINYTVAGTYTAGNIFTAQLSNGSGSFASPVNIGSITSVSNGVITATIPAGTTAGSGYRIRIISSTPSITGTNNGTDLQIDAGVVPSISIISDHPDPICAGTAVTFTATPVNGGVSPLYQWKKNGNNTGTNSSTYTDATLINADAISCVLTSSIGCVVSPTATSNTISSTVNQPTSSITNVTVCSNDLPYIWNNNSYNTAGSFTLPFINAAGCDSSATLVLAVNSSPSAGITNTTGTTILNCTHTSINITATGGASYVWDNGLGNNAAAMVTTPGLYQVIVTAANGCTSNASISISQNLAIPAMPAAITGQINVCPYVGSSTQLTYSVIQDPVALSYQWQIPPTVTLVSGQGSNSITITVNAGFTSNPNKQFRVKAISDCGSSPEKVFYLAAQLPNTPGPISASGTNLCPVLNTASTITYTISKVIAASSYIWTTQAGTTIVTHPNGAGVNDTIVQVSFSSGFSTSAITVQAVNDCGTSNARSFNIARNNPSVPGLISGPGNVCANIAPGGIAATYSISSVINATGYIWTVPAGAIGLTGQGTNSISFIYPAGFINGNVSVIATNGCGNSGVRTLVVTRFTPSAPGVIDVIQQQPCPDRIYSYTVAAMPANTSLLQWTVPLAAGAVLLSGQGTTSITVSYPPTAVTGTVTVTAINNCGASATRQSAVRLPACPPEFADRHEGKTKTNNSPVEQTGMDVSVFPNPAKTAFTIFVTSADKQEVLFYLFDMQGRLLQTMRGLPGEVKKIGNELKSGIYMLETIQAGKTNVQRLLKR